MILYNNTRIPKVLLERFLVEAGKMAGARTGQVVVKVVTASRYISGTEYKARWVYEGQLKPALKCKSPIRWIKTDGAWFVLRVHIGDGYRNLDELERAKTAFETAVHEWSHVKDDQEGRSPKSIDMKPRWKNRPHERRAEWTMKKAMEEKFSDRAQNAVLELAVWMEQNRRKSL